MRAPDRKLRFALAVFAADVLLGPIIAALLHEGVSLERIGLILRADSLRRLAPDSAKPFSEANSLVALANTLQPLADGPPSEQTLASPSLLEPWRSGSHLPALWGEAGSDEGEPHLAPDLERHVRSGSVILAVESLTPREQWRCMRVLLQQNSSSVLALECALPPSQSGS